MPARDLGSSFSSRLAPDGWLPPFWSLRFSGSVAVARFRPAVRDRIFRRGVSIDVSFPDLQRGPALACGALVTVAARAETPQSAIHLASGLLMDRAGQRMGIRSRNPSRKPLSGKSCVRNK